MQHEYEQRLNRLQQAHEARTDTHVLEKQQQHLKQGKSRLIDSYTEGLIDKSDFDPKMAQLNAKLGRLQMQIDTARQQDAGQAELFLVINRLEEFAAAIQERLTCLDFETKRGIIRALVKRIEIYHEEILVVFRVDPDPNIDDPDDNGNPEKPSEQSNGASSMQDCKRRSLTAALEHLFALCAGPLVQPSGPAAVSRRGVLLPLR